MWTRPPMWPIVKPSSQRTSRIPTIVHSISASPFLPVRSRPERPTPYAERRHRAGLPPPDGGSGCGTVCAPGRWGKSAMDGRTEELLQAWREGAVRSTAPAPAGEDLRAVADYVSRLEAEIA